MVQLGQGQADTKVIPYIYSYSSGSSAGINWTGQSYTYKKIYLDSSAIHSNEFTDDGAGKITYTGNRTRLFRLYIDLTVQLDIADHTWHNMFVRIYKSGVAGDKTHYFNLHLAGTVRPPRMQMLIEDGIELSNGDFIEIFGAPTTNSETEITMLNSSITLIGVKDA